MATPNAYMMMIYENPLARVDFQSSIFIYRFIYEGGSFKNRSSVHEYPRAYMPYIPANRASPRVVRCFGHRRALQAAGNNPKRSLGTREPSYDPRRCLICRYIWHICPCTFDLFLKEPRSYTNQPLYGRILLPDY